MIGKRYRNVITEAYDTDAYGNTLCYSGPGTDGHWFTDDDVTTNNPINTTIFTGRQFDPESQIYYYRARYYSPSIGRFISRDPLKDAEISQGPNLYWYVQDNALNRLDATGLGSRKSTKPSSGEGDGDLSDLADAVASHLSQVSYDWARQKAEKDCGPPTGHPSCNCCVITYYVTSFGDNDLYDWNRSFGRLVQKSCDAAEEDDKNTSGISEAPAEGQEMQEPVYEPW